MASQLVHQWTGDLGYGIHNRLPDDWDAAKDQVARLINAACGGDYVTVLGARPAHIELFEIFRDPADQRELEEMTVEERVSFWL